jgi:hypothetical protein
MLLVAIIAVRLYVNCALQHADVSVNSNYSRLVLALRTVIDSGLS